MPALPDVVQREIESRRLRALGWAHGRVLDLGSPDARAVVASVINGVGVPSDRYDTIVSGADLTRFPDLLSSLRALATLLAPGGVVEVIEPVNHVCGGHTLLATLWASHPAVAGRALERDVPAAMRAAGLTLWDLERFTVPTLVWPLREMVHVRARIVRSMDGTASECAGTAA